jgi:hypothetical protein
MQRERNARCYKDLTKSLYIWAYNISQFSRLSYFVIFFPSLKGFSLICVQCIRVANRPKVQQLSKSLKLQIDPCKVEIIKIKFAFAACIILPWLGKLVLTF